MGGWGHRHLPPRLGGAPGWPGEGDPGGRWPWGRWPWDGGPALRRQQSPGTRSAEPRCCHVKWHPQPLRWLARRSERSRSPKKNTGLVPCPLGANPVPRGATKPGSRGCAVTHVLQSRLWSPCPRLVAAPGGFAKPPALPSDGGTGLVSLGRQHRD